MKAFKTADIVAAVLRERLDWQELYVTSAYFKTALDFFVEQTLPLFVAGLALTAKDTDAAMAQRIEELITLPPMKLDRLAYAADDQKGDSGGANPVLGIATRERCGVCHRINAVGFWVPDEVWRSVVHPSRLHDIHCLACFTEFADAKMIDWAKEIKFWPVSLVGHLEGESRDAGPCHVPASDDRKGDSA